jgi:arsenate reductase-like glutaredoxin family protein
VYFTLNPALKDFFPEPTNSFGTIMSTRGKVYRELEGRRTQRIELGGRGYFLKQHFGVGWREIFKNLLQWRLPVVSAKNEWRAIQHCERLGVPTLEVMGFGCRGKNPAQLQSFLLTTELTHVISLEDFCKDWHSQPPEAMLKRGLINDVARSARLLHDNGINHRDFYLCHFLRDESAPHKLYLIDLHRAQIRTSTPYRWRVKDLAGLYFSSKDIGLTSRDLLRFLKEYRQGSLRTIFNTESNFWKRVKQRGDKMYRQHANR